MIISDVIKINGKVYRHLYSNDKLYIYDHANVDIRGNELLEADVLLPVGAKHDYKESSVHLPDAIAAEVVRRYDDMNCMLERSLF